MTVVTQSPTDTFRAFRTPWLNEDNAFESNNTYAIGQIGTEISGYYLYDFDSVLPDPITIIKVELGIEFHCLGEEAVFIRVSKDGGVTWSGESGPWTITQVDEILWLDITNYGYGWTREELLDANLRIKIRYSSTGGTGPGGGGIRMAWTAYLDWIPVRVTYGEVEAPTVTTQEATGMGLD